MLLKRPCFTHARDSLVLGTSCNSTSGPSDPSIAVTVNENVENCTAYDRVVVDLGNARKIVLPDTAVIRERGEAGKVQFYIPSGGLEGGARGS
jgi:hypothetical protein